MISLGLFLLFVLYFLFLFSFWHQALGVLLIFLFFLFDFFVFLHFVFHFVLGALGVLHFVFLLHCKRAPFILIFPVGVLVFFFLLFGAYQVVFPLFDEILAVFRHNSGFFRGFLEFRPAINGYPSFCSKEIG